MAMEAEDYYITSSLDDLYFGPVKGFGSRALWCFFYDNCLHRAAVENWDSFNCESCE